jgi:hypothetical protein
MSVVNETRHCHKLDYVCETCGGTFAVSRRQNHEKFWCSAHENFEGSDGDDDSDDGSDGVEPDAQQPASIEPQVVIGRYAEHPSWDRANFTRIVCVSDTHGLHRQMCIPGADVLVHAGDFTNTGEHEQVRDLGAWLGELPMCHKVVIAGNHDVTFDPAYYEAKGRARFHPKGGYDTGAVRASLTNCTYLEDETAVVCGLNVYGSPWQPEVGGQLRALQRASRELPANITTV